MINEKGSMRHDFEAIIRIFRTDEGGRKSAPFNGVRWDFAYADDPPASGIFMIWPDIVDDNGNSLPKDRPLPVDVPLRANMTVVIDEMRVGLHRHRIAVGTVFYCCEGARRVAVGHVTAIAGLHLDR